MALSIREALTARIGMATDPKLIELALVDLGLEGDAVYTTDAQLKEQLVQAEISVLSTMSVAKSFSEGDLTITYDLNAINQRLTGLRPVEVAAKPAIRNASNWW